MENEVQGQCANGLLYVLRHLEAIERVIGFGFKCEQTEEGQEYNITVNNSRGIVPETAFCFQAAQTCIITQKLY